jgi:hypothetical protein
MDILSFNALASYWSAALVATNILIFFNILGALVLGLLVGYERAYHGHAAGMRTYGLVCMASAALTVIAGYPGFWFGGQVATAANVDPTRVVQGIVTGIGFLGAGVIMKEGFKYQRPEYRSLDLGCLSDRSNGRFWVLCSCDTAHCSFRDVHGLGFKTGGLVTVALASGGCRAIQERISPAGGDIMSGRARARLRNSGGISFSHFS